MSRPPAEKRKRRAGRRTGALDAKTRTDILNAARECFARSGYRATTLRSIAMAAGVTPALLHYYFRNKSGLYLAVVESVAEPLLRELTALDGEVTAEEDILRFFEIYMRSVARHPEMPQLLMHDVLSADGVMLPVFAKAFASRAREAVRGLLVRAQAEGVIARDVDPDLAVISLLSLAAFPLVAAPLIRELFGLEWRDEQLERLIQHQQRIFLRGGGVA